VLPAISLLRASDEQAIDMPGWLLAPLTATSGTMRTLRSPTICMSCITV